MASGMGSLSSDNEKRSEISSIFDVSSDVIFDVSFDVVFVVSFDVVFVVSSGVVFDVSSNVIFDVSSDVIFDVIFDVSSDVIFDVSSDVIFVVSSGVVFDIAGNILNPDVKFGRFSYMKFGCGKTGYGKKFGLASRIKVFIKGLKECFSFEESVDGIDIN